MSTPVDQQALRHTVALVAPHTRGSRRIAAGGCWPSSARSRFRLAEPWPLKVVVDHVVPLAADPAAGAAPSTLRVVVLAGLAVVLLAAGRALCAYLTATAFAVVGSRTTTRLRAEVHSRLLHAAPSFHAGSRAGDLVTRVVSDVGRVQEAAITPGCRSSAAS